MNVLYAVSARRACLCVVALNLMVFGAASEEQAREISIAKVPAVGEKVPAFTLQDLEGHPQTLSALTAESPAVLVVLRGYPGYQCPLCTIQVGGLIARANDFQKANAKVVLVYPGPADQLTERAKEFVKGKALPENFVFLTDPDYKFTEAYGLRWDTTRETAYPSTFVIDRKGIVQFAKVSKTHGDRSKPEDILRSLEAKK